MKGFVILLLQVELRAYDSEELEGSKKRRKAIDVALNRKLVGDITRELRHPGTITGVDTSSCYDRIVHLIVILIMRHECLFFASVTCAFLSYTAAEILP